jgi:hypothetical protein
MRLPSQKKILREDLKDAPGYITGIIEPVNSFMESTYQALNKNITLTDNIASFVKEITYKTPASYPAGLENVQFQNQLRTKPIGVMVMQVYDKTTYIPAPGPVYVPWIEDSGSIIVYPVTGLEADKTYLIRFVIF